MATVKTYKLKVLKTITLRTIKTFFEEEYILIFGIGNFVYTWKNVREHGKNPLPFSSSGDFEICITNISYRVRALA